jgi:two-component system NtrC family sensor kinase
MGPALRRNRWSLAPWLSHSIRNKLLAMALLPLLVVLPLLVAAVVIWGQTAYDRLLITKVRSDLAVAHGYFEQVLATVGSGTQAVADSLALHLALEHSDPAQLQMLLEREQARLGLDFIKLYSPADDLRMSEASLDLLSAPELLALAPTLVNRLQIPLVATRSATATERRLEDRALVMLATVPVRGPDGTTRALLRGGVLLNQNLPLIDHINSIVYPPDALPLGSHGTATLFLNDVRITTNVQLFQDQRAIGTRVSQDVHDAVLLRGNTWLDRAFVVNDWYVSAYEPLRDAQGKQIGMLYVGFLEAPFRWAKYAMLALIVGIFIGVMVLAALFSVRWARSIFKPVERMNRTMQQVEQGQSGARVGTLPARDEIGALAGHLDQLLDVIDEKTSALQRKTDELDSRVIARTQELTQRTADLQQAQQQLIRSEKLAAIGQLTASVAHEINNPIAVMQGNLDLMRELLGEQARPVRTELQLLDQQIERMRLIVTQLLQYAKPDDYAGFIESLDINCSLDEALVLVGHLLTNDSIEVQQYRLATARVALNRQELQPVMVNLLVNALQAMPQGGRLLLHTQDQPDRQGQAGVLLAVCDSGEGISAAAQPRLFRPFFTTKQEGTGLGLWISAGLVERYGGQLSGSNRRDLGEDTAGAIFSLWLPAEAA